MFTFDTSLANIPSIKKLTLGKLERLGIFTVRDMLYHFPHRYEDYTEIRPIDSLVPDEKCTVEGKVMSIEAGRTWKKKMLLTEATLEDASGQIRLIWFNQRFVSQTLKPEIRIRVSGKVSRDREGLVMQNPAFERSSRDATHTGRLVPVYPETAGLTSKFFRWQLTGIFQKLERFLDPVPEEILDRLHLPSLKQALFYIHFPKNEKFALLARKRFAFDEMFFVQLKALQVKALFETARGNPLSYDAAALEKFVKTFPFTLTKAQEKASAEILADLKKPRPMNRLLNGDVGSGKTIVAALAAFVVAENGFQTALLAPTEVLARQHFESLTKIFSETQNDIALFTSSYRLLDGKTVTRPTLLKAISAGIPKIIVGTHALLQGDVAFDNLALIVVDEQHRFGVSQRSRLMEVATQTYTDSTLTDTEKNPQLLYEELTYKIRGALFSIKKQLGLGHKETIYQKALIEEFKKIGLAFKQEATIDIKYDDKKVGVYRPDFIVESKIIVELKALPSIGKFEKQQVWHYLKGSSFQLAMLANFGRDNIEIERLINTGRQKSVSSPHKSATMPHFLSMTATPIPRTLTLAFFGNLDLSLLDELPKDRKPIITRIAANNSEREKTYTLVQSEIAKGRQAFVIFPLVEESLALKEVKAAVAEHKRLEEEVFPHLKIGLLHGKLKAQEKEEIMRDFKGKKYDILVATAVVEVGIDVPNASIIIIEEAERFGLAQLHQFRGRVGRAERQSYCFLFPHQEALAASRVRGQAQSINERLKILEKTTNGFEIAEADLGIRGPGAFFGTRQSGIPDIAMENLTNLKLIQIAREEAKLVLSEDPLLTTHPLLKNALQKFEERIHLE